MNKEYLNKYRYEKNDLKTRPYSKDTNEEYLNKYDYYFYG